MKGAEQMVHKADLRVIKSKISIRNAFLRLIEEKGYPNITIKDIAERAMINRKTFYRHYESIDALCDEVIKDTFALLVTNSQFEKPEFIDFSGIDLTREIQIIIHNIALNEKMIKTIFNGRSSSDLTIRLEKLVYNAIEQIIEIKNFPEMTQELIVDSLTTLFLVMLRWWVKQDACSEEDAANIFIELIH
jgi:AcrR family transcriptional regulator